MMTKWVVSASAMVQCSMITLGVLLLWSSSMAAATAAAATTSAFAFIGGGSSATPCRGSQIRCNKLKHGGRHCQLQRQQEAGASLVSSSVLSVPASQRPLQQQQHQQRYQPSSRVQLCSSSNGNNDNDRSSSSSSTSMFDITKPVFDLYSLKRVRGDALTKYNSLNQSEPLRINIALFVMILALILPSLLPEIYQDTSTLTTTAASSSLASSIPATVSADPQLTTLQLAGIDLVALGSGAAFIRECRRRSRQLTRLEKELDALDLRVCLPNNVFADTAWQLPPLTIQQLLLNQKQQSSPCRVIAMTGPSSEVSEALAQLYVLGYRLVQANTYVVVIPTSTSSHTPDDEDDVLRLLPPAMMRKGTRTRIPWLVKPVMVEAWREYFGSLSENQASSTSTTAAASQQQQQQFKWFGLSPSGRSFASGQGMIPSWLEILGQHVRPTIIFDADIDQDDDVTDADVDTDRRVIRQQQKCFYHALTDGNLSEMNALFGNDENDRVLFDEQVTKIVDSGGRLDDWKMCLRQENRPVGMRTANADVVLVSDTVAYSTIIEFPALQDGSYSSSNTASSTATLLAVQEWRRTGSSDGEWKLNKHQTIPWTEEQSAGGTLIADARGCVSLVRGRK